MASIVDAGSDQSVRPRRRCLAHLVGVRGKGRGCPAWFTCCGMQGSIIRPPWITEIHSRHGLWTQSHRGENYSSCRRNGNDQAT
eukprot:5481800-Pyramimonas_sp.AAC.1